MLEAVKYYHKQFLFRCYRATACIVIFLRRGSHSQRKRPIRSTLNIEKRGIFAFFFFFFFFDFRKREKTRHLFPKVRGIAVEK